MIKLPSVSSGLAFGMDAPWLGKRLFVSAAGTTPTSGWSGITLSPYYYDKVVPPPEGVWDFDVMGDQPSGVVLEVETPYVVWGIFSPREDIKQVRIHAEENSIDIPVVYGRIPKLVIPDPVLPGKQKNRKVKAGNVIFQQDIASFDDSIQPTGWCSFPLHPKMKKLHHTLTLTVEGPDQGKIQQCFQQAVAAGLVAAIIAVYGTGGLALQAAIAAFVSTLETCLGDSFYVRIDDHSHWEEWCV